MIVSRPRARSAPLFAALLLVSGAARAQSTGENANVAEALFREGVALFDRGKIHDACGKFGESFRLDPANGTLQNLAVCHEREGKIASAWAEYTQLAARASQASQRERAELAKARAAELEPRVSRLRLSFAAESNVQKVSVDGNDIGRAAWSTALPVDPGDHVLVFSAPHFIDAERRVQVATRGATMSVEAPQLDPSPEPAKAAASAPADRAAPPAGGSGRGPGVATLALLGGGVIAIGVGGYFGLRAISDKSDTDAHCSGRFCDATGVAADSDAHAHATIATVAVGAGLLAIGGAAALYLVVDRARGTAVGIAPSFGPRSAGVGARVTF